MKKILTSIASVFLCVALSAQTTNKEDEAKIRYNEQLGAAKIEAFIQFLSLTEQQQESFKSIYTEYDMSMSAISVRHSRVVGPIRKKPAEQLTQQDVRDHFNAQILLSQNIINIRQDYFSRFEQILTPEQMLCFFQKESSISSQVRKEYNKRKQELKKKNNNQ